MVKRINRILLAVGCGLLLLLSWLTVITARSDAQKQAELLAQADAYIQDEIYIRALPLLEEAAGYDAKHTIEAEEALKNVYLHLIGQSGYSTKYTNLLSKQMGRKDADPAVFAEAAEYYLEASKESEAFAVLRDGIAKTGSEELTELYEDVRYQYKVSSYTYQDVTAACNGAIPVELDGYWGLASASGSLVIPCEYDQISTYSNGQAIVRKGAVISGVDSSNNRVALFHGEADSFSNFNENRLGLKTSEGWVVANGTFGTGGLLLEELGMYSDGCAAAKLDGKWGVLGADWQEWVIPPEYDGIVQDELGRCWAQDAVFVRQDGQVLLLVDGEPVGEPYEDARPFADGWAAVKKNGKWGFIDTQGTVMLDYQFEDALSFGQHLAAVKQGRNWGYISLRGELVIEPIFLEARSFSQGSAAVRTADGWKFITLLEYEGGTGL